MGYITGTVASGGFAAAAHHSKAINAVVLDLPRGARAGRERAQATRAGHARIRAPGARGHLRMGTTGKGLRARRRRTTTFVKACARAPIVP